METEDLILPDYEEMYDKYHAQLEDRFGGKQHLHMMHTETETHDVCRCGAQRPDLGESWTVKYQEQVASLFAGLGEE